MTEAHILVVRALRKVLAFPQMYMPCMALQHNPLLGRWGSACRDSKPSLCCG